MRRTLPPTSSLACFESTVRLGSVTLAAEELNLTQSAVSKRLSSLEELLGRKLFTRGQRTLTTTPAAREYAKEVSEVINRLEISTARLISQGRHGGVLTIAILPTFGTRWLVPRLSEFLSENPLTELNLISKISPFEFEDEVTDVAIHFGLPDWDKAHCEYLMDEAVVAVCTPSLFAEGQSAMDVNEISSHTLIQHTTRPYLWNDWLKSCGSRPIGATVGPRFEFYAHVIEAALAGIGVAVLPEFLIQNELERGMLKLAHENRLVCKERYYAVYPAKNSHNSNVVDFVNWLKVKCAEQTQHSQSREV
ncbi:LysR family transcriptional regulator [Ruegeria sp. EL01]|jgi:DNA-binding transcriptional LysR family regulator|uniref:LysR family transcriptional regulator n=1 Tax=Ruegeria sp. EL01 TaxID=2107578 RepID=UPI000EA80201|nr:LysR family transcriptional regulator [Ruegeria sp. EL01]